MPHRVCQLVKLSDTCACHFAWRGGGGEAETRISGLFFLRFLTFPPPQHQSNSLSRRHSFCCCAISSPGTFYYRNNPIDSRCLAHTTQPTALGWPSSQLGRSPPTPALPRMQCWPFETRDSHFSSSLGPFLFRLFFAFARLQPLCRRRHRPSCPRLHTPPPA